MKYYLFTMVAAVLLIVPQCSTNTEKLFNGKDLSGWEFVLADSSVPPEQVFSADSGTILVQGKPLGYMYTSGVYGDFRLEVEWAWVGEPSNSGIFFLITEPKNPFPQGIECQLKAGSAGDMIMLGGAALAEDTAVVSGGFPRKDKRQESSEKPAGEWNKAVVEALDGNISITINGVLQNSAVSAVKQGHIGLQSEGGQIRFRNVQVERL